MVDLPGAPRVNLKAPFVEVVPAVTFRQPLPFLSCSTTGRTFFDGTVPPSRTFSPVIAVAGFTVRVADAAALRAGRSAGRAVAADTGNSEQAPTKTARASPRTAKRGSRFADVVPSSVTVGSSPPSPCVDPQVWSIDVSTHT